MILKDLKNNEKGSITVFVLATMLLVTGVIFIAYFSMMNKSSSQASQIEKIQEEYNQSNTMMSQAYDEAQQQSLKLKASDWVYYEDAKGIVRKCIVLYDESSGYGTQIISEDVIDYYNIGASSYYNALQSYNNAISNLNDYVQSYVNTTYATSGRCVGSDPKDKDKEGNLTTVIKEEDSNYLADYEQMKNLGILNIGKGYWLASRSISTGVNGDINYNIRYISTSGVLQNAMIIDNTQDYTVYNSGLRAIFELKDKVKITGGSGTQDDPYTLGA